MDIQHDSQNQQFTMRRNGHEAELAYTRPAEGTIDFTHTFVGKALRGQGIADELARHALDFARREGAKVKTSCEFMAAFVQKNEGEYGDLLA